MTLANLEKIEEVRICFDWETMIIPSKYVKKIMYNIESVANYSDKILDCSEITLEVDLHYIKTHKYYMGNSIDYYKENHIAFDSELTIYERLQDKDVWYLEIIDKNQNYLELNPPTNRKEYYCSEKEYIMAWDAPNACEIHNIVDDTFKMEWSYTDDYMNEEEIQMFFKKENLTQREGKNNKFGLYLFEHILLENKKEKDCLNEWDFYLKSKYKVTEKYQVLEGVNTVLFNIKYKKDNRDNRFIFIPNANVKDAVYKIIEDDKKNCVSKWIFIFNDDISIEDFLKDYKDKEILENRLLYSSYLDMNKFWLQFKKDNHLL